MRRSCKSRHHRKAVPTPADSGMKISVEILSDVNVGPRLVLMNVLELKRCCQSGTVIRMAAIRLVLEQSSPL